MSVGNPCAMDADETEKQNSILAGVIDAVDVYSKVTFETTSVALGGIMLPMENLPTYGVCKSKYITCFITPFPHNDTF